MGGTKSNVGGDRERTEERQPFLAPAVRGEWGVVVSLTDKVTLAQRSGEVLSCVCLLVEGKRGSRRVFDRQVSHHACSGRNSNSPCRSPSTMSAGLSAGGFGD